MEREVTRYRQDGYGGPMLEHYDGCWVKYDDYKELLDKFKSLQLERDHYSTVVDRLKQCLYIHT